ncbi:uncharacterized protein AMSG_00969 [Thecamonas trahens ATCC 50062]|uniref:Uncharacterized protein n=1 Tax=Thecamonas trahens ATCC 50062 TaxID=461836 RepID=A0A0L0DL83_THETB|nr:hypothetical protein AMSG_00969 [Thecamonas trahens ATCC 50062]KNC52143.1 hypothetical protein AMSG_00969 [Thecamonas trahens ATCC 50062]|eukprot:XP_013762146.1 hypothetical protein AMSG_00969 [Thecamonas trahens ATCC 50062]
MAEPLWEPPQIRSRADYDPDKTDEVMAAMPMPTPDEIRMITVKVFDRPIRYELVKDKGIRRDAFKGDKWWFRVFDPRDDEIHCEGWASIPDMREIILPALRHEIETQSVKAAAAAKA